MDNLLYEYNLKHSCIYYEYDLNINLDRIKFYNPCPPGLNYKRKHYK